MEHELEKKSFLFVDRCFIVMFYILNALLPVFEMSRRTFQYLCHMAAHFEDLACTSAHSLNETV